MEPNRDIIEAFWNDYVGTDPQRLESERYVDAFAFGDTADLADGLANLVLKGIKTATSMLMLELEIEDRTLWEVGDKSIVLASTGIPVCVIETTQLEVKPFSSVNARFVYDYGEGDRSLDWWNTCMKHYYFNLVSKLHKQPSEDMLLICERFRVVFPSIL